MDIVSNYQKLPRLHVDQPLAKGKDIVLSPQQAHYLKNVLRKTVGDRLRLFNGINGEWLAALYEIGKKNGHLRSQEQIKTQPESRHKRALYFAPIKKNRMDFLIEKAVELGVTDFYPVLTARTEIRKINQERLKAQIIEASEQCERLTLPALHPLVNLDKIISSLRGAQRRGNSETQDTSLDCFADARNDENFILYACIERHEGKHLRDIDHTKNAAFLIGPEGGFTPEEIDMLASFAAVTPITLGENILRAETAAIKCLAAL